MVAWLLKLPASNNEDDGDDDATMMLMMSMDADYNMGSCDDEDDDVGGCSGGVSDDADWSNNDEDDTHGDGDGDGDEDIMLIISFHFIGQFRFTILFSHCPQIAKASLGGLCLERKKHVLQMVSYWHVNKKLFMYIIQKVKKGRKVTLNNNAEVNWNTE